MRGEGGEGGAGARFRGGGKGRTEDEVVQLRVDVEGAQDAEGGDRVCGRHDAPKHQGLPRICAVDCGDVAPLREKIEPPADGEAAYGGSDEG